MAHLDQNAILKTLQNLRNACDFVISEDPWFPHERPRPLEEFLPRVGSLSNGSVVYVRTNLLDRFFSAAFPSIEAPIVLVTAGGPCPTPGTHRRHLEDDRILRWFGQNYDLPEPHPKFEPLPIGFMDACWPAGDQAVLLEEHRRMPPVAAKPLKACASFQFNRSHPERDEVLRTVWEMPGIVVEPKKLPPALLWARHAGYAFAISPRGSGFDCHRTWESILLRTIPIVRSSHVDPLYRGFPVVIVSDWREITPSAMAAWRERLEGAFTTDMFARLTLTHWLTRIARATNRPPA